MSIVVCHTAGCENENLPIAMELTFIDSDTGESVTIGTVMCGPCGQTITDVSPPAVAG